jgi:hypothetical protein
MISMWGREINSAEAVGAGDGCVIFKAVIMVRKRWMKWRGGEGERSTSRRGGGEEASARQNVITGAKCDHGTAVVVWVKVRCRGDVCLSFDLAWTGSSQISNPPVRMVNICPEI